VPRLQSFDGTSLSYEADGDGPPVVLLHGFAADAATNWVRPGVVAALLDAGRRVITLDARGHGQSDKPHDPAAYADDAMVRDVQALLDHLGYPYVDVVGYSMGSITTARLLLVEPRLRSAVLGGIGAAPPPTAERRAAIAEGLVAEDPATIANPSARAFRRFADSTLADRHALAAIQRASRATSFPDLGAVSIPVLVLTGDRDALVGSPHALADRIPGATVRIVSGDHLSAVNDPEFARAIVAFLEASERELAP
jgi:pimeloyl-ACP methyl ester carboxylesterase